MEQRDDWRLTDALHHELGRGDPFAAAVRSTRMAMIITDPRQADNPIVFANEAFQKLTGYSRDEVLGRNCRFLQGSDTDDTTVAKIRGAIKKGDDIAVDILNYRKDGSTFWNALYLSPVRNADGDIEYFFASQVDVTGRIAANSRLSQQRDFVEREVRKRTVDLEASLEAQKLLLHEVDHRVKNNMAMIGAILRLQLRDVKDEASASQLRQTMQRIDALSTVHRRLYQSDDVTLFDVGAFTVNLASDLTQASPENVRIVTDLQRAEVPASSAAAVGLVINEVLVQIFQALPANTAAAKIRIEAFKTDQEACVVIEDEGMFLNARTFDPTGMSHLLTTRLAQQGNAKITHEPTGAGTRTTIRIGR